MKNRKTLATVVKAVVAMAYADASKNPPHRSGTIPAEIMDDPDLAEIYAEAYDRRQDELSGI